MAKQLWFGNAERMTWIPCPRIEMGAGTTHYVVTGNYLNGGAAVRRSATGSRLYELEWSAASESVIDTVESFWEGAWGQGPFYFLDPQAMKTNIFPAAWAQPRVALDDGPKLVFDKMPTKIIASSQFTGWDGPKTGVQYLITEDDQVQELTLPVPPGYSFAFRADQNMSADALMSYSLDGGVYTPFSEETVTAGANGSIVKFAFSGTGNTALLAMQGVMYKDNAPSMARFISGKGNSGCEFVECERTVYSAAMDKVALYASLQEIGDWL